MESLLIVLMVLISDEAVCKFKKDWHRLNLNETLKTSEP